MRHQQCTIYAKNAGVEIAPYEKRHEGYGREGRISLRFFSMEDSGHQIRFVAQPGEGYALYRMINKVYQDGGKESLTHKYEGSAGETITKLSVEKYERNGKPGYAILVQRGSDNINIATCLADFLYAGEFLKHLSLTEAWVDQTGRGRTSGS